MYQYVYIEMAKNISLSENAYRTLKNLKLGGESFSDTVLRLSKTKAKLSQILSLYPELKGDKEYLSATSELRKTVDKRLS